MNLVTRTYDNSFYPYSDLVRYAVLSFVSQQKMDDRLAQNYTEEKLELDECDAITLVKDDEKLIMFSTLLNRPLFGNAVRCINRFYKTPASRCGGLYHHNKLTLPTFEMIEQQMEFAKTRNYDIIFASRELKDANVKTQRTFDLIGPRIIGSKHLPDKNNWIYSPNMHLVMTPKHMKSNWQSIVYYKLKPDAELQLESMSLDKYREQFVNKGDG